MESSDSFGLEIVEELAIQSVRSGKEYKIDYYPLSVSVLKSICTFVNEWTQIGILRLETTDSNEDQHPQKLVNALFGQLCDEKRKYKHIRFHVSVNINHQSWLTTEQYCVTVRPLLQHVVPDMLKCLFLIQNQHVYELPVQLLSQLLFSAPELFIQSLCPPVVNIQLEEEAPGLGIKYPKPVRLKIDRVVAHRREYVQQILLNASRDRAHVIYQARMLLQSCFNALQDSMGSESEVSTYHAISLCIDLVHNLTLQKRKKNVNQCITALSSELCSWTQKICDNVSSFTLHSSGEQEHEATSNEDINQGENEESTEARDTIELMLCIVLDLCALVVNKFGQLLKQYQQSLMRRLLFKLKLDLPTILASIKQSSLKFEETANKIQHLIQLCHTQEEQQHEEKDQQKLQEKEQSLHESVTSETTTTAEEDSIMSDDE